MNLLSDIITYVRRIIKSPSNSQITDDLIIDYINRFYIMDVSARIQLFDLKTKYQFMTVPGVDQYNMPLYDVQTQPGNQTIGMYPVYQGFTDNAYINGIKVPLQTLRGSFYDIWINVLQNLQYSVVGDGTAGPYTISMPILPNGSTTQNPPFNAILRGHVDITGIMSTLVNIDPPVSNTINTSIPTTSIDSAVFITSIDATGAPVIVEDSGQFLTGNVNYGLLMTPGKAPFGNTALPGGYSITSNTINYLTGIATVEFPVAIPLGNAINAQCRFFSAGLPRAILFYNNVITLRSPPSFQYVVELDAFLSPAAFLNTSAAIPFGYMSEYIARGAARKILSDTGDVEQFQFYEPLFREQESLVHIRSQRQWTSTRTPTIYSQGIGQGLNGNNNFGSGAV
jgi:hypothetical protein